jgi:hypothetical protein
MSVLASRVGVTKTILIQQSLHQCHAHHCRTARPCTQTHAHTQACAHTHAHIHKQKRSCTHKRVQIRTGTHTQIHTHKHTHTYTYTYTHTHTHTHTHTRTRTHTQAHVHIHACFALTTQVGFADFSASLATLHHLSGYIINKSEKATQAVKNRCSHS